MNQVKDWASTLLQLQTADEDSDRETEFGSFVNSLFGPCL